MDKKNELLNKQMVVGKLAQGIPTRLDVDIKEAIDLSEINSPKYVFPNQLCNMVYENPVKESEPETEEWIWVTGYKGTDKDMKCRDYQFEMGVKHDMPEDAEIVECQSGFHLCHKLDQVFNYYNLGNGNRYFEVSALVRKNDWAACCLTGHLSWGSDKLVAKSIIFLSECDPDEILTAKDIDITNWTEEDKKEAITTNPNTIIDKHRFQHLKAAGYSKAFAHYLTYRCCDDIYDRAMAIAAEDVSMDVKVMFIMDER